MKSLYSLILGLVLSVPVASAMLVLTDAQADSQANAITHPGKVGQRVTLADYPNYGKSGKSCKSKKKKKKRKRKRKADGKRSGKNGCSPSPTVL